MAEKSRPSDFMRRLVRPAPRAFVPLLHTNVYQEVQLLPLGPPLPPQVLPLQQLLPQPPPLPPQPPLLPPQLLPLPPQLSSPPPQLLPLPPRSSSPLRAGRRSRAGRPYAPSRSVACLVGALRVVGIQYGIGGADDPSLSAASSSSLVSQWRR
ncbi:hypothetical protein B0H12DRAFT_1245052, partial [Mycena haematopus]